MLARIRELEGITIRQESKLTQLQAELKQKDELAARIAELTEAKSMQDG